MVCCGIYTVSIRQPSNSAREMGVRYSMGFGQGHSAVMNLVASQQDLNLYTVIMTGTKQHLHGHVRASFRHVNHRQAHKPQLEDRLCARILTSDTLSRSNESPIRTTRRKRRRQKSAGDQPPPLPSELVTFHTTVDTLGTARSIPEALRATFAVNIAATSPFVRWGGKNRRSLQRGWGGYIWRYWAIRR